MTDPDPILTRVEAFDRDAGGGVTVEPSRGGHNLTLTATGAPIARLKPVGPGDTMRVQYWSYRNRWKDVGDSVASCCRWTKPSTPSPTPTSSGG